MSSTGLDVVDKTLQTTHIWLDEIMAEIGPDRQLAWHALGGVLRSLRDRLPVDVSAHLGAQLPLLVRGAYYDQWRPAVQPRRERSQAAFLTHVADDLAGTRPVDVADAARAVFGVLQRHITAGQINKVKQSLPEDVRTPWPDGVGAARGGDRETEH